MKYHFQDFTFNSENLLLLKQGAVIKLRVNEAKLLAVLLKHPEKIISKEDIFDSVWAGKVISEQPIFQNISRLRAILGNDAIINHPKKGYQWQIPLNTPAPENASTKENKATNHKKSIIIYAAMLLAIALTFVYFLNDRGSQQHDTPLDFNFALMPINSQIGSLSQSQVFNKFKEVIPKNNRGLSENINEELTFSELDANIEFNLPAKLSQYQVDGLIFIKLVSNYGKLHLHLSIKSQAFNWHSELLSADIDGLLEQFKQQLTYINSSQLIGSKRLFNQKINSQFQILHQQHPNDANILIMLIESFIRMQKLNDALLLAQKLEQITKGINILHQAHAYKLQGRIYTRQNYLERAHEALALANNIYIKHNDFINQIGIAEDLANVAFHQRNYSALHDTLTQSITLSKKIDDYKNEFWTNLYLSKFADTFQNASDKAKYFEQGNNVYDTRFFVDESEIKYDIYYNMLASQKQDEQALVTTYQKLLATANKYPEVFSNYKYFSLTELVNYYLKNQQFDDALALFDLQQPLAAIEKNSLAKIYARIGDTRLAIDYAKQGFSDAALEGDIDTALSSASFLIQRTKNKDNTKHIHKALYEDYIKRNAPNYWLKQNSWLIKQYDLKSLKGAIQN